MLLARNWWVFALRGLLSLLFGLMAIFLPEQSFMALVWVIGIYIIVDGVFMLVSAFSSGASSEGWWWLVIGAILAVILGILIVFNPLAASVGWIALIGFWAIFTGVTEIFTAIRLRKIIENEWWMILSGLISIIFGVLVLMNPFSGMFAIGIMIGVYALIWGVILLVFAFRLKSFGNRVKERNA